MGGWMGVGKAGSFSPKKKVNHKKKIRIQLQIIKIQKFFFLKKKL